MRFDPDLCHLCFSRGRVVESRVCGWYRRRRHWCPCGERWTTYQHRGKPRIKRKIRVG